MNLLSFHIRGDMRLWGVVGLGLTLTCCAFAAGILHNRRQASMLLEDIKHLEASTNSFSPFQEKHRHQLTNEECNDKVCEYEYVVSNWILSSIHLTPRAELRAMVIVFNQNLDAAGVEYTSAVFKKNSPVVHVQEDFCADRTDIPCDHFGVNPHGRGVSPAWNGIVEFGQRATNEQKARAWAVNLGCFAAIHGCSDISQLSPKIWKAVRPGIVSSRVRSTSDSAAEATQPLPE